MKVKVIPSATFGTIRVPKLKKATDNKLLFKKSSSYPLYVEIIYSTFAHKT